MKFTVQTRTNPRDPQGPKMKYAVAVNAGRITLKDFAREISGRSSLTRGDIENVLSNFLDELPTFLKLGMSVQLGEFGTLRLSIASEAVDESTEFTVAQIKGVRVIFTPGVEFKEILRQISFEEAR
jgi:predicted histone-like DNA-binding protein